MGKRPFYIIHWFTDYEGGSDTIIYFGDNYKEAKKRYRVLYDMIRQRHFLDEGVDPDRIEENYYSLPDKPIPIGNTHSSYINDQCEYYLTISLTCITKGAFAYNSYETDYQNRINNV